MLGIYDGCNGCYRGCFTAAKSTIILGSRNAGLSVFFTKNLPYGAVGLGGFCRSSSSPFKPSFDRG